MVHVNNEFGFYSVGSGGRSRSYSTGARPQARSFLILKRSSFCRSSRNTARSYSSGSKTQARPYFHFHYLSFVALLVIQQELLLHKEQLVLLFLLERKLLSNNLNQKQSKLLLNLNLLLNQHLNQLLNLNKFIIVINWYNYFLILASGGNGFFSTMAQGFAFGAGSAVAHK